MKDLFNSEIVDTKISFEEAVKFFSDKVPLPASKFYKLADEYRNFAFTVAGYSKAQVLKKFYDELLKSIADGTTLRDFKTNMDDFLIKKGYKGLTNYQADNIFRTNIQTAFNVGHYRQMTEPTVMQLRPYWMYSAINDGRTRPTHRAMDGKVFEANDPIWDTWYPPNGYKCRCNVISLSKRQVESRGLKVEKEVPDAEEIDGVFVNILPDQNFNTNPAKHSFNPDMKDYPESIKKAFEKREKHKK